MHSDELKECPFCGAIASYDPLEGEWIRCANKECDMSNTSVGVSTWQSRPTPTPSQVESDTIERCVEIADKAYRSNEDYEWITGNDYLGEKITASQISKSISNLPRKWEK